MPGWKWPWTRWMERKEAQLLEREQRERQAQAERMAAAQRQSAAIMATYETQRLMRESQLIARQKTEQQQENLRRDYRRQAVQDMAAQRVDSGTRPPPRSAPRREEPEPFIHIAGPYHADDPYPAWLMQQATAPLPSNVRVFDDEPRPSCRVDLGDDSSRSSPSSYSSGDSSPCDSGGSSGGDSGGGGTE